MKALFFLFNIEGCGEFFSGITSGQLLIILHSGLYGLNIKVSFHWSKYIFFKSESNSKWEIQIESNIYKKNF
jgi:hypothetical protein